MPLATLLRIFLTTFGTTVLLFQGISCFFPDFLLDSDAFWIGQAFFVVLFFFSSLVGKKIVHHQNINFYTQFTLFYIFTKMMFSTGIVIVYFALKKPPTFHYLAIFLFLYTTYTTINVCVLNKIGRERENLKKY